MLKKLVSLENMHLVLGITYSEKQFNPLTSVPAVTSHAKTHPQLPALAISSHKKNLVRTIAFPTLLEDILSSYSSIVVKDK